jgi:hypothetical protein
MMDRIQKKLDAFALLRREIAAMKPMTPRTESEAIDGLRRQYEPYVERLNTELSVSQEGRLKADAEIERLNRCLRVLGATADQYGMHYPKWSMFAGMVQRALGGERL